MIRHATVNDSYGGRLTFRVFDDPSTADSCIEVNMTAANGETMTLQFRSGRDQARFVETAREAVRIATEPYPSAVVTSTQCPECGGMADWTIPHSWGCPNEKK